MKYKVKHRVEYQHTMKVPLHYLLLRLMPSQTENMVCHKNLMKITPVPSYQQTFVDYFGNHAIYMEITAATSAVTISSTSVVEVEPPTIPIPSETDPWDEVLSLLKAQYPYEGRRVYEWITGSPIARPQIELSHFVSDLFPPGRPVLESVLGLIERVMNEFAYSGSLKNSREEDVPSDLEILRRRSTLTSFGDASQHRPVDDIYAERIANDVEFAHLVIACLRSIGLAARFVTGYLVTVPPPGSKRLNGADSRHSWVSVYCGSAGWLGVDPTINALVGEYHIPIATGREFSDVRPVRGYCVGGGETSVSSMVDVEVHDGD